MKPKYLKKVGDGPGAGRVFAYTDALAARSDMVPVWPDGEQTPNIPVAERTTGLDMGTIGNMKEIVREKDATIKQMQATIDELVSDNQKLNDRVAELENGEPSEVEHGPPRDDLPADQRMDLLVQKTVEMIRKDDPNEFTGQGVPRVGVLEAYTGIADVTSEERDKAFKAAKKQME